MWILHDYIISEDNGCFLWRRHLADGVFMFGRCTLGSDVLILHSYDCIEHFAEKAEYDIWRITAYFMTVNESGSVNVYNVSDGETVSDKVKSDIGTQVGCTLRFRQG